MLDAIRNWLRRPSGPAVIVVSGLPRSGTSMMMRMLASGGLEIVSDGVRSADAGNPAGYYECERVKTLDTNADKSWLETARGKAIKIISFLLRDLPETNNYRVIFMHRDLDEIMASQQKMLGPPGAPPDRAADERIAMGFRNHLNTVRHLILSRPCFDVLDVHYPDVLDRSLQEAERINGFLDGGLDLSRMAAVVDRTLYRSRR